MQGAQEELSNPEEASLVRQPQARSGIVPAMEVPGPKQKGQSGVSEIVQESSRIRLERHAAQARAHQQANEQTRIALRGHATVTEHKDTNRALLKAITVAQKEGNRQRVQDLRKMLQDSRDAEKNEIQKTCFELPREVQKQTAKLQIEALQHNQDLFQEAVTQHKENSDLLSDAVKEALLHDVNRVQHEVQKAEYEGQEQTNRIAAEVQAEVLQFQASQQESERLQMEYDNFQQQIVVQEQDPELQLRRQHMSSRRTELKQQGEQLSRGEQLLRNKQMSLTSNVSELDQLDAQMRQDCERMETEMEVQKGKIQAEAQEQYDRGVWHAVKAANTNKELERLQGVDSASLHTFGPPTFAHVPQYQASVPSASTVSFSPRSTCSTSSFASTASSVRQAQVPRSAGSQHHAGNGGYVAAPQPMLRGFGTSPMPSPVVNHGTSRQPPTWGRR